MGPEGVACLDVGFPMRYSHSALEVVDPQDLAGLVTLLDTALSAITPRLTLTRWPLRPRTKPMVSRHEHPDSATRDRAGSYSGGR